MSISYPLTAETLGQKTEYLLRLRQYCIYFHNYLGYWYRNGLTQDEYDNGIEFNKLGGEEDETTKLVLSAALKSEIPYVSTISRQQFNTLLNSYWNPRFVEIEKEYENMIGKFRSSKTYDNELNLDIL